MIKVLKGFQRMHKTRWSLGHSWSNALLIFSQYRLTLYSTAEPWRPLEVHWGVILYVYCIYIDIQLGP